MPERPAWHTDEFPELRSGPPWVTEEMVAAQPGLARQMLESPPEGIVDLAASVRAAVGAGEPVSVVGCGTSEHGALAIAALVDEALGGEGWPPAIEALLKSLDARSSGRSAAASVSDLARRRHPRDHAGARGGRRRGRRDRSGDGGPAARPQAPRSG